MNEYEIAITVGVCLAAMWVLAYILCWIGQWAWAWINDSEVGKRNKMVEVIALRVGYEIVDYIYMYRKNLRDTDGEAPFFICGAALSISPLAMVMAFSYYPVSIGVATAATLAFMARFALRHKKLFDKHIVSKGAHK